jgi:ribosomal protein S18 acetylase RimI-like enzyme
VPIAWESGCYRPPISGAARPPLRHSGIGISSEHEEVRSAIIAAVTVSQGDALNDLCLAWCDGKAARVVHELTQAAFAPQMSLDPPSGATQETLEVVRADLTEGRGVLASLNSRAVAAARALLFDDHVQLRRLAVDPEFQRRGIASALMRWVQDQASLLGYREIRVGVRKVLESNRALYEGLGYTQVGDHGYWVELRLWLVAAQPNVGRDSRGPGSDSA